MTYFKICEHDKVTIRGGKQTGNCISCSDVPNESFYTENLSQKFNIGLGCYTYGTRDAEKKAKARGLVPIGDAKINEVFSKPKDEITPIIRGGMQKIKHLGSF